MASDLDTKVEGCLELIARGNAAGIPDLFRFAERRLDGLARKMLRAFPLVANTFQAEDLRQEASLRLFRALSHVRPVSANHFFRLAALEVRRALLDQARWCSLRSATLKYRALAAGVDMADARQDPSVLGASDELADEIAKLPTEQRQVVELLSQGLTQREVARAVRISVATLKRRLARARRRLLHAGKLSTEDRPLHHRYGSRGRS